MKKLRNSYLEMSFSENMASVNFYTTNLRTKRKETKIDLKNDNSF